MLILIKIYNNPNYGNYTTETLNIPNNLILVSELKALLYKKLQIHHSQQRLTVKIVHLFVTMTDEWPLSFFHIKNDSIIFLEHIHLESKMELIRKKLINTPLKTKSKYLVQLGFYTRKRSLQSMGTINESPNEIYEEHMKNSKDVSGNDLLELAISAVKNNNLIQIKELIEQYNVPNIDEFGKNGWNALHYASYFGYSNIVAELVIQGKCNPNVLNTEGWTALHLAAFKGYSGTVGILISLNNINVDCNLEIIGTALHCACKKNNFKSVSTLLHRANPFILDSNGKYPIDLTTDMNIKKLIRKMIHQSQFDNDSDSYTNSKSDSNSQYKSNNNSIRRIKGEEMNKSGFDFLNQLDFIPPKPPKAYGFVEKSGRLLPVFRFRYIEIDPLLGIMKRFKTIVDYPNKPNEIISLINISNCSRTNILLGSEDEYYFELVCNSTELYRVTNLTACDKWIEIINAACIYAKFWHQLSQQYKKATEYLYKQKTESIFIDGETGEIRLRDQTKKKARLKTYNRNSHLESNNNTIESEEKLLEDSSLTKGVKFDSFEILELLGSGTFGKVFKVKFINDGNIYAMKAINKKYLMRHHQLRYAITECNVLKLANNPFIVKLHYAFQTMEHLYMILDYCAGGDMGFILRNSLFDESDAKFFIAELIIAIEHLHNMNIIYRDLKPDNILIDNNGHIKLADFGLAKENVNPNSTAKSFCGSAAYLSPEMLQRRGVGKAADLYGIGAVLYEMICGTPPFYSNDMNTLFKNISQNNIKLHDYFSEELQDLLIRIMNREPHKRLGVKDYAEIRCHPWFDTIDWEKLEKRQLKPPINLLEMKNESNKFDSRNGSNRNSYTNNSNRKKSKDMIAFDDIDYNKLNHDIRRVKEFTFVRPVSPNETFCDNENDKDKIA